MKDKQIGKAASFYNLEWDTGFFGVNCAKAILHEPLKLEDWNVLKNEFKKYQFISIENRGSEPINAQLIGKETKAFLADVNIQFKKRLNGLYEMPQNIEIHQALERNKQIIEIAEFRFSKFTEDPELAKRRGSEIYQQWLINSFGKVDKYFALSKDGNGKIVGFLLYSYSGNTCVVELIAVSKNTAPSGTGTSLFKAVECVAYDHGCEEMRVGTQIRNLGAIDFYHKVGCKQVECHQVYHLWNL